MTTLLLAEDNDLNRELFVRVLQMRDYEILEAGNGREAIEMARKAQPAVILMDLSMPVMDGWDATRKLKSDERTAHIPVVAVTAHVGENERQQAFEAGCDAYLGKPFHFDSLFETIESVLDEK